MTTEDVLGLIGGEEDVRNFLRGVEPGSEMDKDALRAMKTAIERLREGGVCDEMARHRPYLYGQACLTQCELLTDAQGAEADRLERLYNSMLLQLRHSRHNHENEVK